MPAVAVAEMRVDLELDGVPASLTLRRRAGGYEVETGGGLGEAALLPLGRGEYRLRLGSRACRVFLADDGDRLFVRLDGRTFVVREVDVLAAGGAAGLAGDDALRAPMPGTVVAAPAAAGAAVRKGEALMVIESMKLQTTLTAWRDGTVAEVRAAAGAAFDKDAVLLTLAPLEA